MRDQLINLCDPKTFEQVRFRYRKTVEQLANEGKGRRTISRVGDKDAYWSPTVEVLEEAMRLGYVQREQLPSARQYVDKYREHMYSLTERGREVAELAEHDQVVFVNYLTDAVITVHPYFRTLLLLLDKGALVCPEISEGELELGRQKRQDTDYWAVWAADRINIGPSGPVTTTDMVKAEMVAAVNKRFGRRLAGRPSNKALAQVLNDAFASVSLASRGLPIDATTLGILKSWGEQLRILDQSRYVPGLDNSNVIWLAADIRQIDEQHLEITRRGLQSYSTDVARAIVTAYQNQAELIESSLTAPYLPIYQVRAEAAYACKVTRSLVDLVLERLTAGEFADIGVQVWLHLGSSTEPPVSEPVYRRGGNRRYEITIVKKVKE